MSNIVKTILSALDQTGPAFSSAMKNMRGLQGEAGKLNGLLGKLGVGVSVAGMLAFTKSTIDSADGLQDMSDRLGVSVKDLASFKLAADLADTSLEGVGKGIAKLTLSIGEATSDNKKMAQALIDLGITARDPKEAFFQLADAVKRIDDPAKRATLLNQVLGKSYQELLPLLNQGGDALRKAAQESESFADAMERLSPDAAALNDNLDILKNNTAGFSAGILTAVLPSLNEWIGNTDVLIERHGVLLGLLSAVGAAAVPSLTAAELAGSVTAQAFQDELEKAKKELAVIEAAKKSGTFGLIQLALYGSKEGMERQGNYLKSQIATVESSIAQFKERQAASNPTTPVNLGDSTAQLACVQGGGTWDGKKCNMKPSGADTKRLAAEKKAQQEADEWRIATAKHNLDTLNEINKQAWEDKQTLLRGDDAEYAFGQAEQRLASIRQRLDAEVSIGAKSQIAAQIELREETGKLGGELSSLLPRLQALATAAPDEATREKWRAMTAEISAMQAVGQQVGPMAGLKAGLDEYANAATDTFAMVKESTGRAFKGMEDSLVSFVRKGKLDFTSLADSIIDDMIRMQVQQNITKPLSGLANLAAKAIGNYFFPGSAAAPDPSSYAGGNEYAAILHTGGGPGETPAQRMLPSSVFTNAPRFHSGIGPGERAAVIRTDESVLTPGQMRQLAPVGGSAAPVVEINVINNSGNNTTAKQQGQPKFDGRKWVLGIVLEAASSDPGFRAAMNVGGR